VLDRLQPVRIEGSYCLSLDTTCADFLRFFVVGPSELSPNRGAQKHQATREDLFLIGDLREHGRGQLPIKASDYTSRWIRARYAVTRGYSFMAGSCTNIHCAPSHSRRNAVSREGGARARASAYPHTALRRLALSTRPAPLEFRIRSLLLGEHCRCLRP